MSICWYSSFSCSSIVVSLVEVVIVVSLKVVGVVVLVEIVIIVITGN